MNSNKKNNNLVHTPKFNIPVGERCTMDDGSPGVTLKYKDNYEQVSAIDFIELIFGKGIWSYILRNFVGSPSETTTTLKVNTSH